MPRPDHNPLTTWLAQVLGPILIMAMVGSLVFFFIEILYRGPHATRLCWVLGLFTIASVLVSRVSIQEGFERASLFGLTLALATLITSTVIVDFNYGLKIMEPFSIAILIGVVMWSSSKLTWDCTVVDNSRDVSASGLLDFAARRWRRASPVGALPVDEPTGQPPPGETAAAEGSSQFGSGILSRLFSKGGRQNTPGLWVFYFSLFALPVFGVGQWFAASHSRWGDTWIFLLFAVYLGSGLGLLMVTSLLGLNRYLRRRNLSLPQPIAQGWLTIGSLLAGLMMALVLLVPRPDMTASTSQALAWFSSSARRASDMALGRDGQQQGTQGNSSVRAESGQKIPGSQAKSAGPQASDQASQSGAGKGQGQSGAGQKSKSGTQNRGSSKAKQGGRSADERPSKQSQTSSSPSSSQEKSGEPSRSSGDQRSDGAGQRNQDSNGQPGERSNQDERSGERESGEPSRSSGDQRSDGAGQRNQDSNGQPGERSNQDERSGERERAEGQSGRREGPPGSKRQESPQREPAEADEKAEQGGQTGEPSGADDQDRPSRASSSRRSGDPGSVAPPPMPRGVTSGLTSLAKGLLFLVGLVALVALTWLYRDELAEFWAKLFGQKKKTTEAPVTGPGQRSRKPAFGDFVDPFRTGRGSQWTERQLIQYTFAALEAWARGRQYEKEMDETPYEFAKQILVFDRVVGKQAVELAHLYCRAEYSQQGVHRRELKPLLQLWQEMSTRTGPSVSID